MYFEAVLEMKNPRQRSTMDKLYEQRHETGDIKFVIESEEISAHRNVLAAVSPKYKAQFYGAMAEKDVVNVSDVSASAFGAFLRFCYAKDVTLTIDNIEDVLDLAKQSLVDELVGVCTQFLFDVAAVDKLILCYRLALRYEIDRLQEFCVKHIGMNVKDVFKTVEFLSCEREILSHILDFDSMNCDEVEVFEACISWARAKCKVDGLDVASTSNLRAAMGAALYKIRFCSMSIEQFARISKTHAGLLTGQESVEVFQAIGLKADGEISNIFGEINGTARTSIEPLDLECTFNTGSPIKDIFDSGDCIRFFCDKTINLNGFVICHGIFEEIDVTVKVSDTRLDVEHTKWISGNETVITFNDSIRVESNELCNVYFLSKAFQQSNNNWYGYHVRDTKQYGVSFTFPPKYCGGVYLITRLLFSVTGETL